MKKNSELRKMELSRETESNYEASKSIELSRETESNYETSKSSF